MDDGADNQICTIFWGVCVCVLGGGGGHKTSEKANCVLVWALINLKSVELKLVLHALRVAGTSMGFCAINVVWWLGPPQIEAWD